MQLLAVVNIPLDEEADHEDIYMNYAKKEHIYILMYQLNKSEVFEVLSLIVLIYVICSKLSPLFFIRSGIRPGVVCNR
jgi:hypothetical protein